MENLILQVTQVIQTIERLTAENQKLKQDITKLESANKIKVSVLTAIEKISESTGVSIKNTLDEFLRLGIAMHNGNFKEIPIAGSVYETLNKLAKGRLQQVGQITTDEEFTNWTLYGLENEKF